MNNTTQQTTFWKFLSEHTIEIPIIQRDYAQGRKDKISLRKGFLGDLKKALDWNLPNGEKNLKLKLDFVYGSTENGKLQPLDGQQRLTTLWLLHWYIALRAGKLADAAHVLSKFTYETRISSREFCKQLCMPDNFQTLNPSEKIVPYITNQTWFFSAWKQDPTILAMLTMLSGTPDKAKNGEEIIDGLEEAFTEKFDAYWQILTSDGCPIIFYYLDLLGLKLSDDLYIKMNARGKQLTSFENFKADLIKYINEKKESSLTDEEKNKWNTLLDPEEGLPIKMDTTWMDIFWKNKSEDFRVDEIYFAFLNRFFWNELFILKSNGKDEYVLKVGQGKIKDGDSEEVTNTIESTNKYYSYLNQDDVDAYSNFDLYRFDDGEIPLELFNNLQLVLDRFYTLNGSIPECSWDKNFHFIPRHTGNGISTLNQQYRIVFFAVCKYLKDGEADESSLKRWMRVVWNLVSGEDENGHPEIRSTSAMRTAIEFISKIDSHNVYESLSKLEVTGNSVFDERCKEEIAKVEKILEDINWEKKIIQAESYAFFKGAIRFLFRDENGEINEKSWEYFDPKWDNAREYFDEEGVKDKNIDVVISFIKKIRSGKLCNYSYSFQKTTWKKILLGNRDFELETNHLFLMNDDKNDNDNSSQLRKDLLHKDWLSARLNARTCWWFIKKWSGNQSVFTDYERTSGTNADRIWSIGNHRNQLLDSLKEFIAIQYADKYGFYKGLHIDFQYEFNNETYYFRFYGDNYVYLMNLKPVDADNYTYRNPNAKGNDDIVYCCFNAKEIVAPKQFIEHLNGLIKEHESRCAQCTGKICE